MNSNPDLEKQVAVDEEWLANRVLELQKQVAEQQREIARLQEYPARYAKLLKERDSTIQRLKEALQKIESSAGRNQNSSSSAIDAGWVERVARTALTQLDVAAASSAKEG